MRSACCFLLTLWISCGFGSICAGDADAEFQLGSEALRSKDYRAAAEAFDRAVGLDPGFGEAWFKLGLSRSALQEGDGAIEAYRRVIELEPRHAKALNNLANVYFRRGAYDEALVWYRRALEVDPDYLLASFHCGWILRQLNQPRRAERMFQRCLSIEPENDREEATQLDCLFYYGALRFRAGDHSRAATIMEEVLAQRPAHSEARYYLGMAYRHLGRVEEAQYQLELHAKLMRARHNSAPVEKLPEP